MKKLITFLSIFIFFVLLAKPANAARLYLDPPEATFGPGDSVELDIKIDVIEACINTIEAELTFPKDVLDFKDFLSGDSIMSLWLEKPATADAPKINNAGLINFAGGIPGGYCGKIPGDPGDSNIVGRLIFTVSDKVLKNSQANRLEIAFTDKTRVLNNDGLGTENTLLKQAAKVFLSETPLNPDYDWQSRLKADRTPPEPFIVELRRDNNMFGGAYYLTFATVDKQTGVDHYEVLELRAAEEAGIKPKSDFWEKLLKKERPVPIWQIAQTPYVLRDQDLLSKIKVKALDKAGNERIVEYVPESYSAQKPQSSSKFVLIMVLLLIAGILVGGLFAYRYLLKRKNNKDNISKTPDPGI